MGEAWATWKDPATEPMDYLREQVQRWVAETVSIVAERTEALAETALRLTDVDRWPTLQVVYQDGHGPSVACAWAPPA